MHTCGHTLGFGATAALELIDAPRDLSLEPLLRLQLELPRRYRYTRAQQECEHVQGGGVVVLHAHLLLWLCCASSLCSWMQTNRQSQAMCVVVCGCCAALHPSLPHHHSMHAPTRSRGISLSSEPCFRNTFPGCGELQTKEHKGLQMHAYLHSGRD